MLYIIKKFYFIVIGPLVTMMGKMVKNMIYYLVLLLVVLMSFGVSRQAILYPDKDAAWSLIKEVSEFICTFHFIPGNLHSISYMKHALQLHIL